MATIAFFVSILFLFHFLHFLLCFCIFFFSFLRTIEQAVGVFMFCARAFCLVYFAMSRSHKLCVASKRAFHKCWFIAISGRDMKINIHSSLSMVWIVLALHNRACFRVQALWLTTKRWQQQQKPTTIWNGSFVLVHFGCRLLFIFCFSFSAFWHSDVNKTCLRSTRNKQKFRLQNR